MIPMKGVYKDKGYAAIRIWLGPKRNPDGTLNKPLRRTFGRWSNVGIQDANNYVTTARENYRKGILPGQEPTPLMFPIACDIYEKRHWEEKEGRSDRAVQGVGYQLERFRNFWRDRSFHTILPSDIDAYVTDRKNAGIKATTINQELGILSSLFNVIDRLVNRREIGPYLLPTTLQGHPYNPVSYVDRAPTISSKRERVASDLEILKVKLYCDAKDPDMLELVRRSMLTGLRKTDLKKVNGLSDVRGILSKSRESKLFKFPVDFSRKLNYTNFPRRWNDLRKNCGMEDFHWHDWRHTSATILSTLGFTDEQVQQFTGHKTLEQVRNYINRGKERLIPHVEGLDGHLEQVWSRAPKQEPPLAPKIATDKTCLGCRKVLELSSFGTHSAFKDGKNSRCKACCYQATADRRKRNPGLRAKEYAQYVDPRRSPSSVVEHSLHMGGVVGSNPSETTISEVSTGNRGVGKSVGKVGV